MKKHDLSLDEVAFDSWAEDYSRLEVPLAANVFSWGTAAIMFIGLVVVGRVLFINIGRGDFYQNRASANVNKEVKIPAYRGVIMDRFGEPLVRNVPTFSAVINALELAKNSGALDDHLEEIGKIVGKTDQEIKELIRQSDIETAEEIIIAHDITLDQAINLRALQLDALQVRDDYRRQYLDSPAFAHVLGYVGVAETGSELEGKTGLEAVYDDNLRGVDGKYIFYRDVQGKVLEEKLVQKARVGFQLNTTIDADLQKFFYERFKQHLQVLNRDSGAGLAIDPRTGEVLALLSFPEFDNNRPAHYLNAKNRPLFNRVISGVYSPGSSIKPLVALAALEEKVVTPVNEFYSPGYLEIPNPYDPSHPSRFLDWQPQGYVNLYSALAKSSNVYFYIVGGGFGNTKGLGIERLMQWWDKLLLGKKTDIDLPAEKEGFLYSPEEKEEKLGEPWRIGDTYNVSIGQGNLAVTPIRLLTNIAMLAMNGKAFRPFVAKSVIDERSNLVLLNESKEVANHPEWDPEIHEIKKGLRDAVAKPYGTASYLASLPLAVAGKTGSAQISNNTKTNAFFVGYAPADDPQIALLILIENSREGSLNTLPIARDVFEWYYYNRM